MPSSSYASHSEFRSGKERSGGQTSKDNQKHKPVSAEKSRVPGSKSGKIDNGNGRAPSKNFSAGFRIASTTPHSGKVTKKEKPCSTWQPKSSRVNNVPEHVQRNVNGHGNTTAMATNKTSSRVPAQPICKTSKRRAASASSHAYSRYGTSSQEAEPSTDVLPDPYLELTNLVNQEIKELADSARARLGATASGQSLQVGATPAAKSFAPSPSPRSPPSARVRGVSSSDLPSGRNSSKGFVSPDTVTNCKSPVSCSGSERGSRCGSRSTNHKVASSSKHAGVSTSDGGDGYSGCASASRAGNVAQAHGRRTASSSCRDASSKRGGSSRHTASATPEQIEDDDEDDETGMPQGVVII
ncbi:hypothetical protein ElyMa_006511400 [Elysia marginata]|uniref:Uncharacterized protein n=1 Tax=Elysia marginata TaxID=1093978 RepID=A0AAV4I5Y2_9GAST|nr:hypothetical protein ElyMa_006511400 [Elysia marginata]